MAADVDRIAAFPAAPAGADDLGLAPRAASEVRNRAMATAGADDERPGASP